MAGFGKCGHICGRQVKKPATFLLMADQMVDQRKVAEVLRAENTCDRGHVRESGEPS